MSFSDRLTEITDKNCREIEIFPQMQAMLKGEMTTTQYIEFLLNLYPIVSNFCPIMGFAVGHCADKNDQVRRYLYDHMFEEMGHEQLVLGDLRAFGVDVSLVPARFPSPPVQAMLGYNYHASESNPCCVLGMIYVLEIMAFIYGGKVARSVSDSMNRVISQGFTFLDSHAELDEDHIIKLKELFLEISHEGNDRILLNSIKVNFYLFKNIICHQMDVVIDDHSGHNRFAVNM